MTKLNLVKMYKSYYKARTKPEQVAFDKIAYLTINGEGAPAEGEFVNKEISLSIQLEVTKKMRTIIRYPVK